MSRQTRNRGSIRLWVAGCALACAGSAAGATLGEVAAGVKIDPGQISVSGISSGGFMAHQFHVAHSDHVMGAGIVAGGPYDCAEGTIMTALSRCMKLAFNECKKLGGSDSACGKVDLAPKTAAASTAMAQTSFAEAQTQEQAKTIDRLANLKDDRVYLFIGTFDSVVPNGVMDALFHFYADPDKAGLAPGNIQYNETFPAPHTMVRDDFDKPTGVAVGDCPATRSTAFENDTFIDDCAAAARKQQAQSRCVCPTSPAGTPGATAPCPPLDKQTACRDLNDVDLAGAILTRLYGGDALKGGRAAVAEGQVETFDQRQVFSRFSSTPRTDLQNASMAKEGYIFIPETCRKGKACRLHVAFHGCLQGGQTDRRSGHSGNLFSKYAGYNEWAQANDIIVLYPQVEPRSATIPQNPKGCWDWWGQNYTHNGFHTQRGPQVKAVAQMVNILASNQQLLTIPE